jgi:hypothetical protein
VFVGGKEDVRGDDVGREVKSGKAKRAGRLWLGARATMACRTRQCRVPSELQEAASRADGKKETGEMQE